MSLRTSDTAPGFSAETTAGPISFHAWLHRQARGLGQGHRGKELKPYLRVVPQPGQ